MIILPNLKGVIDKAKAISYKILPVGNFTSYNGNARNRIISLNSDSTIDSNFNVGTGFDNVVNAIALQADGKIIAGGIFISYNGTSRNCIARLNTDGTNDSSFNINRGFVGTGSNIHGICAIALQSDGKILCGGAFTSYYLFVTTRNRIARLNTDGTNDSSFNIGSGFTPNQPVRAIAIQSDGKILAGGGFTSYNGTTRNRIARLNTDGTYDSSFNIGSGFNSTVNALAVQSDGKILCGGDFTSFNGISSNYIARLNADGTLDSSFNIGPGFNGFVRAIAIQSDGKILVGGNFTAYNGTSSNYIARLNTDGTYDSSFNIGSGFNNTVNALAIK